MIWFLSSLILFCSPFLSASMEEYEYILDKASRRIRELPITRAERTALYSSSDPEEFISNRVNDYLKTKEFATVFATHLEEHFRMRTSLYKNNINSEEPLKFLFESIARDNLSMDKLLTAREYITSSRDDFYSFLNPTTTAPSILNFAENEKNIAGAITTFRFFTRYVNTAINKNRRRAAAILRIFLGIELTPAPASEETSEHEINKFIFGKQFAVTEAEVRASLRDNIHGAQGECFQCHKVIDPLGQVFATSGSKVGNEPAKAALILPHRNFIQEFEGFSGLAKTIIAQPEYSNHMVQKLWDWFIGTDVPLLRARKSEMVNKFEEVGRRSQDFVKILIHQPEFRDSENFVVSTGLTESLKAFSIYQSNCAMCHNARSRLPITFEPLRVGNLSISESANRIYNQVVETRQMPKGVQLPDDDVKAIRVWLEGGAMNQDGVPQLER